MLSSICVSIAENTRAEVLNILDNYDFAEIRLDLTDMDENEIKTVFAMPGKRLIATCRQGKYNDTERISRLKAAIESGAYYVDIEVEENNEYQQNLIDIAKKVGCKVIISHHDFDKTPDGEILSQIILNCKQLGADLIKLVTTACVPADNARVLALYSNCDNLLAFAMGAAGKISRLACLYLGAPFTYASVSDNKPVANGQLSASTLENIIKLLPK